MKSFFKKFLQSLSEEELTDLFEVAEEERLNRSFSDGPTRLKSIKPGRNNRYARMKAAILDLHELKSKNLLPKEASQIIEQIMKPGKRGVIVVE